MVIRIPGWWRPPEGLFPHLPPFPASQSLSWHHVMLSPSQQPCPGWVRVAGGHHYSQLPGEETEAQTQTREARCPSKVLSPPNTLLPGLKVIPGLRPHLLNQRPEGPRRRKLRPRHGQPGSEALTSLVLPERDDVWIVVVDEAWESTGLATAHADLAVPPLACLRVLSEGHQPPAKENELWGNAWHGAWGNPTHNPSISSSIIHATRTTFNLQGSCAK